MGGPFSLGKLVLQMEAGVCWACCMCREVLEYLEEEGSSGVSSLHSHASFCCLHDHSRQDLNLWKLCAADASVAECIYYV